MDDKVKHRIVGIVVIAAFLVILVPALIKNVVWNKENQMNQVYEQQATQVAARPASSEINETPQSFETSQIAQVSLDHPNEIESDESMQIVPASTKIEESVSPPAPQPAPMPAPKPNPKPISEPTPKPAPAPVVEKVVKPVAAPVVTASSGQKAVNYCLQLGTFANPTNAQLLVDRLHAKGFPSAKAETVTLPMGRQVKRVNVCRMMTPAEAAIFRSRLARITGNNVIIIKQV